MHLGFVSYLFIVHICLSTWSNRDHPHLLRRRRVLLRKARDVDSAFSSLAANEPNSFFRNEPVPLSSSLVDDLTTLASAVYIITVIALIFVILAWITHYNAPCSSFITSVLSTITGLPEPIIHSVALCGVCCMWCETTWLFRRIHQFNVWMSNRVKAFISNTCKRFYDNICPCCRPPDTPSNRSIIGSLRESVIAAFRMSEMPTSSPPPPPPPPPAVVLSEPVAVVSLGTHVELQQVDENKQQRVKRVKRPRKKAQPKQGSAVDQSPFVDEDSLESDPESSSMD